MWSRWKDQLDKILQEIYTANLYRVFWRGLAEMTQAVELPASGIFDAFGVWYATTQATAVRRQLDHDPRSVSLWGLLDDIARNPQVASRQRHVARWLEGGPDGQLEAEGHDSFDLFAGGRDQDQIDPDLVRVDIAELEAAASAVREYTNKAIAHTDVGAHQVPTFVELNAAIDQIGVLAQKYASLLKAEMIWQVEPVIQYDWKAPFRKAWLLPEADE
jgi:hypothetical protein